MRLSTFAALAAASFSAITTSLPTSNHAVHEKRSTSSWSPDLRVRPNPRTKLPVRIGLKESNVHLGDDILMQLSDPKGEMYGKHWSPQQVGSGSRHMSGSAKAR